MFLNLRTDLVRAMLDLIQYLNRSIAEMLRAMASADVLVDMGSSFAIAAATLMEPGAQLHVMLPPKVKFDCVVCACRGLLMSSE